MWTGNSEYSLTMFLFISVFLVYSDARATPNEDISKTFSSAVSSASAFAGTFGETGYFPGIQDGHKEIRSYDSIGHNIDRGAKSYGTPSGHGASHDHSIKGGGHDYNRNGDGCSKCKWENDDYWEQDEPEEEENEDECDDGDDGQYRPHKTHHHDASGSGRGHAPGSHSHQSGVYKQGPAGVYVDDGINTGVQGGKPGGTNFPTNVAHAGTNSFGGTTSKPGTGWSTPFASKPIYGSAIAGASGTTPSSWPSWNTGTPDALGSSPKPTWNSGYDDTSVRSFVTTLRPETNWNIGSGRKPGQGWNAGPDSTSTTGFPSSQKPGWHAHDKFSGNFGTTSIPGSNWNTGRTPTSTPTGLPSSEKPSVSWTGREDGNFRTTPRPGQNWNVGFDSKPELNSQNPNYGPSQSGCIRPDSSCNQGKQVPVKVGATPIGPTKTGEYPSGVFPQTPNIGSNIPSGSYGNQNQYGPYGQSGIQNTSSVYGTSVTSGSTSHGKIPDFGKKDQPFSYDNKPYAGEDQVSPNTGSGTYSPGNIPDYSKSGYGSESHDTWPSNVATTFGSTKGPHANFNSPAAVPGVQSVQTKPSYGTVDTYAWSTPGQIESGSSSWHNPGSPHARPSTSNTRFPTSKPPFSYGSTSGSTSDSPYVGTGPKPFGFNIASSSATANAGASAFATSFGTHNVPGIIGTTSSYDTTLTHGRGTSYPGVKGFPGSIRPTYETPYNPNVGNAWPDNRSDKTGSGISPSRYPETVGSTWPTEQSRISNEPRQKPGDGSGIAPGRYSGNDGTWPNKKPEGASGTTFGHSGTTDNTWPSKQPGSGSGLLPTGRPGSLSETTPGYFGTGNGNRPTEQSIGGSGTWPNGQSKYGSGSGCSDGTCRSSTGLMRESSNCGSGNDCGSSCGEGNYPSTVHRPCSGLSGPSGVNKTYYPAGTGDGNVPNLASTYGSNLPSNIGTYPGTGCGSGDNSCNQVGRANVIPERPIKWNSANPFLFGSGGSTPSYVSRPWNSGTTVKPLGQGNPFLDSNWSTSKPGYNANNKNVTPFGQENNKPTSQGSPFLDNSKRRGDIDINANAGDVSPFGGRKPEGSNPFIRPGSGSNSPSYGRHSVGFPGSGIPKSGGYGENDGFHPGEISSQGGSNTGPYSTGGNPQRPLQCKLGIFGCGTPGSGSYAATKGGKHPEGSFDEINGNARPSASSGSIASAFGGSANFGSGIGSTPGSDYFGNNAGRLGSAGNNVGSIDNAHRGAYAGSFSSAQASSFASAKSLSSTGATGIGNNFGQAYGGSWPSSGAQNPGGSNSWASGGASAFASSSSGSWSGNRPTDVKG